MGPSKRGIVTGHEEGHRNPAEAGGPRRKAGGKGERARVRPDLSVQEPRGSDASERLRGRNGFGGWR